MTAPAALRAGLAAAKPCDASLKIDATGKDDDRNAQKDFQPAVEQAERLPSAGGCSASLPAQPAHREMAVQSRRLALPIKYMGRTACRQSGVLGKGGLLSHPCPARPDHSLPASAAMRSLGAARAPARVRETAIIEDARETGAILRSTMSRGRSPAHPQEGTVRRGGIDRQPDCFVFYFALPNNCCWSGEYSGKWR